MQVFKVEFDYCEGDSKEVTRERMLWTGCWISVAEAAIRHAEEYDKELMGIEKVMPITRQCERGLFYYPDELQATPSDQEPKGESSSHPTEGEQAESDEYRKVWEE